MRDTETAVRNAKNPQEAMLAIAVAIDSLLDRQTKPDAWGSWGVTPAADIEEWQAAPAPKRYHTDEQARAARLAERIAANPVLRTQIEATEALLSVTGDATERAALEARLRVLREDGGEAETVVEEGITPIVESDGNTGTVDFADVSMARKKWRYQWAKEHQLWDFIELPIEEACEAFAKGGPMWLYLSDAGRDALLAMPPEWRAELIDEVQQDSPSEAQMMGRDLMKTEDVFAPESSAKGQFALAAAEAAFNG